MALDVQTIPMVSAYIPYERPPQALTLWSAIPRGLQSFFVATATLDAKALNDEMLLSLTALLPPNFGYVMADCNLSIAQDEASDWINAVNLNLQNFYRGAVGLNGNWFQEFPLNDVVSTGRAISVVNPWPAFPIIGTIGTTGIQINLSTGNAGAAATTAGTVNGFISFWQFDLEQIRKFPINSPIPVQAR